MTRAGDDRVRDAALIGDPVLLLRAMEAFQALALRLWCNDRPGDTLVGTYRTEHDMTTIPEAIGGDLQSLGGFLNCRTCHTGRDLGNVGEKLSNGWPKCCGQTMEWITRRQIDEGYMGDPDAWIAKEKAARG